MTPSKQIQWKVNRCREVLRSLGSAVVGVSGGVDSTLLLALAADTLGKENVLAATATGLYHAQDETTAARAAARQCGVELVEIDISDLDDPKILDNPPQRCYWCKRLIFGRLAQLAERRGLAAVISGSNADDLHDHRPGRRAEEELDVGRPLQQAGLSKEEIRLVARAMKLAVWNKPSSACLASRVAYGRSLRVTTLRRIERTERALRTLGFVQCRCRDHDDVARIEVPLEQIDRALARREEIVRAAKRQGYTYVTLDLEGFRSGSADESTPEARH